MLVRHFKKEAFVFDNEEERDAKALSFQGKNHESIRCLRLFEDKELGEEDEFLVEVTTSWDIDPEE